MTDLARLLGPIDIYLLDQMMKGRVAPGMRVVDAGCGYGRNLVFLRNEGYDVWGVDWNEDAVASFGDPERFRVAPVEKMPFPDAFADVVISSAVLHFAADEAQFAAMVREMWRVLRPGGMLFVRLASSIGLENEVAALGGRRFALPDGSERFLVDAAMLERWTEELGGEWLEPLKTTVVQGLRSMSTWVIRKAVV
jgi:SAM-dependent methyltransferase